MTDLPTSTPPPDGGGLTHSLRTNAAPAIVVICVGLVAMWEASHFSIGELRRIGPAVFPMSLGALLVFLGIALLFDPYRDEDEEQSEMPGESRWDRIRSAVIVLASLIVFSLLIDGFGIIVASMAGVIVASFANRPWRPVIALLTAVGAAVALSLLTVYALGLHIKII